MLGWPTGGGIIMSYKHVQRKWDRKGVILSSLKAS